MPAPRPHLFFGIALALAGLVLAPLSVGCSSADSAGIDGGAVPTMDASLRDGGYAENDSGPALPDDASVGTDGAAPYDGEDVASGGRGCFDFVNNDGDGLADCADPECASTPLCCVGSSAPGCCTASAPRTHDFSTCAGSGADALATCDPSLVLFGSPLPDLRSGAVVTNGGDRYDSGLVLPELVDPRTAVVRVSAIVRASIDAPVCTGCVDFVALGLVSDTPSYGATSTVSADVAVVVNNTRRDVRLLVGDDVVGSWRFDALGLLPTGSAITLVASPSGTIELLAEGTTLATGIPWSPAGPARVVAYGRTANPGAGDPPGVELTSIEVATEVCDSPASIERGATPILPAIDPWWVGGDQPTSPSILGSEMLFAFEGRIHRARATSEGRFRASADPHDAANAMLTKGPEAWRSQALDEPELVWDGTRFVAYFTAIGEGGRRVIGRALGGATLDDPFTSVAQFYPAPDADDGASYDGATHLSTTIGGDHEILAVRRHTSAGGEIVLLEMVDGAPSESDVELDPATGLGDEASPEVFLHRAGRTAYGFDADEIASPGLVAYDGLIRLYFAGRHGTRWSIGMLASSDGRYWHLVEDGAPLLGGAGAGFDAISVSEPEPVWIGDELRLYYTASDGVRRTIGMGHHRVTETAP